MIKIATYNNQFVQSNQYLKILLTFLALICAPPIIFSQQGFLKIECSQPDLEITLNDSTIGTTPIPVLKIQSGKYELSISNPHKGFWKCDDWVRQIVINRNDTTVVTPTFKRHLTLISNPYDAQVFIENEYIGNTPLYLNLHSLKQRKLLITKDTYKPYRIDPTNITTSTLKVTLDPIVELQKSIKLKKIHKEKKIRRHKNLTYSLLAFTIAMGFTSVYLKDQAEKKYDQYLMAGNLNDMNRFYSDAKNFDKYYSVSLGVFEVSFALSMYLLIKRPEY